MELNRRELLRGFAIGTSMFAAGVPQPLLAQNDKPFITVLSGIMPSTAPERFLLAADQFLSREIPACYVIDLQDHLGRTWTSDDDLAVLLRRLKAAYPGLVEFAVRVPQITADRPYFQVRRASEAQSALGRALTDRGVGGKQQVWCLTLATDEPPKAADPLRVIRAAGFRNALYLPRRDGPRGFWQEPSGTLQIHGGFEVAAPMRPERIAASVSSEIGKEEPAIAYLTVSADHDSSDVALAESAAAIGEAIVSEVTRGRIYCTLPSELHRGSVADYGLNLVLRIDHPQATDADVAQRFKAFAAALLNAGIPFSYAGRIDADGGVLVEGMLGETGISICPMIEAGDQPAAELPRMIAQRLQHVSTRWKSPTTCVVLSAADANLAGKVSSAGIGILGLPCGSPAEPPALDRDGLLHLPPTLCLDAPSSEPTLTAALFEAVGTGRDALAVIGADAIATHDSRQVIVKALGHVAGTPGIRLINVEQFGQQVLPGDDAFNLLKLTKAQRALASDLPTTIRSAERQKLEKDAEIAWSYFDTLTNKRTGLIPATASLEGGLFTDQRATMWDVGSTLIGLVAANAIGLVDTQDFMDRVEKVLAHIGDTVISGLRLPSLQVSTDGRGPGETGFDASDTGRLLICLKVLERHVGPGLGVADLVGRWDLGGVLIDDRLHSFRHGSFKDVHGTNYANYIARGFRAWGFTVAPVYPVSPEDEATDAEMRLLYQVADRGSVGTEPHVLEAIELGYSDAARTIADLLYTAQMRAYVDNGTITCVSEGPLDRAPWFTFQGYRIGANEDPWTIETTDNLPEYKTATFRQATRMVSSKAAFLWSAVRPQAYSRLLLSYVRERAQTTEIGYSSGIRSDTGQAMPNYSDINTNGIILSAIAYILRGRKPLINA